MTYPRLRDLPKSVRDNLPKAAQEIYRGAFNNAWEQYADPSTRRDDLSREETAHRVAWSAVKQKYEKRDRDGKWVASKNQRS
jgi:cation transport regulator